MPLDLSASSSLSALSGGRMASNPGAKMFLQKQARPHQSGGSGRSEKDANTKYSCENQWLAGPAPKYVSKCFPFLSLCHHSPHLCLSLSLLSHPSPSLSLLSLSFSSSLHLSLFFSVDKDPVRMLPSPKPAWYPSECKHVHGPLGFILDQPSLSLPFRYPAKLDMDSLGQTQGGKDCTCLKYREEKSKDAFPKCLCLLCGTPGMNASA